MTTDQPMTVAITSDDPVFKAMQEINRLFFPRLNVSEYRPRWRGSSIF